MSIENQTLGITQNLKSHTIQQTFNDNSFGNFDLDVDSKVAHIIYTFLVGKIDKLPNYEYLTKTADMAKSSIISIACGLAIDKNLTITIEEPVSEKTTRIDRITPTEYTAILVHPEGSGVSNINLEELSKFSPQRVAYLQKYLSNFHELTNENDSKFKAKLK